MNIDPIQWDGPQEGLDYLPVLIRMRKLYEFQERYWHVDNVDWRYVRSRIKDGNIEMRNMWLNQTI